MHIEDNVPMPERKEWSRLGLEIGAIKPGQSVLVPKDKIFATRQAIRRHKDTHGTLWTTKAEGDGMRVWRVS